MAKGGKGRKGGGGGGGKTRKYSRDNKGRFASTGTGATARGGRLLTAKGNKRKTQTMTATGQKGVLAKPKGLKPGAIKPKAAATTRKGQLAAGAQRRNAQANRIDAKVKALEGQYRSKDAAFYTQGAKPAGRDRMIAKSQQAAQLREQSAALRTKAANAEKMSQRVKGTAASKKQERRNAFDTAGYKVGDTVTTRQYGTQKITKISKNSVSFEKGNTQDKAFMANYLGLQATSAAPKPVAPKPASTAAERIKIKTPIRRAMSTNRASVVTPGQRSRLETGKGAKTKGARLNSSVAKPRTAGNTKPQVASRVKRKLAAENAKMNKIVGAERVGARQGKQYERSLKRQTTLERAKTFLESGKLPGKDNSIAAQRNTKQARQRLAAKNAERRSQAAKPAAISEAKAGRIISRIDANRPGLRRIPGSARKTANAIRTHKRATDFALAASARGRKQGKNLSVNQSLQRAIKNASAKRKPRPMR